MTTTTDDVSEALSHLSTVELQNSEAVDGVRVAVNESEAGQFFKAVRQHDFDATTKRIEDTLVSHIRAEQSTSLRSLFNG